MNKQDLQKKIEDADIKIPDTNGLVNTAVQNRDISEVENKISDASSLVTKTFLNGKINEVQNKIPYHAKYITTYEFNKLRAENFAARLKQANLATKTYFNDKLKSFNRKIPANKTKYLEVQKKLNSLITKDYHFFSGKNYFASNDGSQNTFFLSTSP